MIKGYDYFNYTIDGKREKMAIAAGNAFCDYKIKEGKSFSEDKQNVIIDGHVIPVEVSERDPEILTELIMTMSNALENKVGGDTEIHYEKPVHQDGDSVLLALTHKLPPAGAADTLEIKLPVAITFGEYKQYITKNSTAVSRKIIENRFPALFDENNNPDFSYSDNITTTWIDSFESKYKIKLEKITAQPAQGGLDNNIILVAHATATEDKDRYNFNVYHVFKNKTDKEYNIKVLEHYYAKEPFDHDQAAPGIVRTKDFRAAGLEAAIKLCVKLSWASNVYLKERDHLMRQVGAVLRENLSQTKKFQSAAAQEINLAAERAI